MNKVVIVAAKRTPIGSFGGVFKDFGAVDLGTTVLKELISQLSLDVESIDEVIMGNVLQTGLGQNVARQISVNSGIPVSVPAFTINKVCGSGLKSVQLAAQSILLGDADVVVAGGTENMSQAPYLLKDQRWGKKMGNSIVEDTLLKDGLTDAFSQSHMGITAENIADKYNITREEQDEFAYASQQKAITAQDQGEFIDEIVPVTIESRFGEQTVENDEYINRSTDLDKLSKLRTVFKKDGSVTAGNASGINDGAAILILMSEKKAKKLQIDPIASIVSYASSGVAPEIMGTGPISSTQRALEKANLSVDDLDLIESNEAFASQAISVITELNLDKSKVNVNGGAIALGHPIGASGARILTTLIYAMKKKESKYGLATLCIGGGQGISMIIEKYNL